jgi:hypothetical protein
MFSIFLMLAILIDIPYTQDLEAEQLSRFQRESVFSFCCSRAAQPMLISIAMSPFDKFISAITRAYAVVSLRISIWKD